MTDTPTEREGEGIWTKLRRRKVVQWGIGYAAAAWGVLQGLQFLAETYEWSSRVLKLSTLAFLIGLPIALVLAWYHGDRGEQRLRGAELAIITLLFLVAGAIFWRYEGASEAPTAANSTTTQPAATTAALPEALPASEKKSIAVLPFVNMSSDPEQEYFSDGLSEEVLNLLVKLPELKVIARTSSFGYKGKDTKIADIARELRVAHVLEGSVRKAGNKVRITAQLVHAADSSRLWSETYDRTLEDVFAVQDDIARHVVKALEVKLLGDNMPTTTALSDTEAYNLFLQGRSLAQRWNAEDNERGIRYLEQSLMQNPNYAPAWVELANVYMAMADINLRPAADAYARAREATEKALAVDPNLAAAHSAKGWILANDFAWTAGENSLRRALKLEPGNAQAVYRTGILEAERGRPNEALPLIERSLELDPLNLAAYDYLSYVLESLGRYRDSEAACRKGQDLSGDDWSYCIGTSLLGQGKVLEALHEIARGTDEAWRLQGLSLVYHAMGRRSEADSALGSLKDKHASVMPFRIAQVHAFRGEPDLAFEWLERAYVQRDPQLSDIQVNSTFHRLKDDPRYTALLKAMKFPE